MAKYDNPHISPYTPRMGNAVTRAFGEFVLSMLGWRLTGRLPDVKKVVVIGAPHTSIVDFFLVMAAMLSVGLKFSWMMKKEAFFFPFVSLLKWMGGVPIDRSAPGGVTGQMTRWFDANDNVWLGITPDGTRNKVDQFKKGYLRIAYAAGVPVFVVGIDAKSKEIVLDKLWPLTGDGDIDNFAIKKYFDETFVGINPERQ